MATPLYHAIPSQTDVSENLNTTDVNKSSLSKRFINIFVSFIATIAAIYIIIIFPLTSVNTLPVLIKTEPLNVKLIPTKLTSFKDDKTLSKSEKYITKTKWEELHSANATEMERMIIIGDVHGSLQYLENLLSKINFNKNKDQVIFLGDLISKGDKNIATLNFAMENHFKGVLGNHELNVLSKYIKNRNLLFNDDDIFQLPKSKLGFDDESVLSSQLNSSHYEYLTKLPFIMDLGLVPHIKEEGKFLTAKHGIVDHMGVPDAKLSSEHIKISDCLEIDKKWYSDYNKVMSDKSSPTVVYYGHHAGKGLNIREFSNGLDTGCVYGQQLSSFVLWTETITASRKKDNDLIVYKSELVQVECSED